jgi:hypothetical protein
MCPLQMMDEGGSVGVVQSHRADIIPDGEGREETVALSLQEDVAAVGVNLHGSNRDMPE